MDYKAEAEYQIWPKFPRYRIYPDGRVYSERSKRFLKPGFTGRYHIVNLCNKGEEKNCLVHRLVAICFVPNPDNKPEVNHKDGNKINNHVSNLEWVTKAENEEHARANGLVGYPSKNREDLSFPVEQYDLQGNFIAAYPSIKEAQRVTGIKEKWISVNAKGGSMRKSEGVLKWVKSTHAGGFKWMFTD